MSKRLIRQALETRLATWAAAHSPALRIAFENVSFRPNTGETYLRAYLLPANTSSDDLAGAHRGYTGVFQVSIVVPPNSGTGAAATIEAELDALFPVNLQILVGGLAVQMMTPMSGSGAIDDDDATTISVSTRYRADTI